MARNWLSLITDSVLSGLSAAPVDVGSDYNTTGSVCTSRLAEPTDGRSSYHPNPERLRQEGFTEEEIRERCGGNV
jgi:hypothetical protein